jgi:hypothetical protein
MGVVGTLAAVIVGVAFLVAGASKIVAREAWPAQARDLGAPAIVVPVLPVVEIVLGALLTAQVAVPVVGALTLVLLAAFTALIGLRLAQGRRPACACFGAWSSSPIGAGHVIRNVALMALAVTAVVIR